MIRLICQAVLSIALLVGSYAARADIAIQWQITEIDERQQLLAEFLTESNVITDLLSLLQENFEFEPSLRIVIGAMDGPLYDVKTNAIRFPYSYISEALEAQMQLLEAGETAVDRSLDVVEYTLYHLVAHALVESASPDEDGKVEQIASWLMVRGFQNGAEQLVTNARAFGAASQKLDGSLQQYWHEHALFARQQSNMECWALGNNPVSVEPLLRAVLEPEKRVSECRSAWLKLDQQVREWIGDRLKEKAPIIDG